MRQGAEFCDHANIIELNQNGDYIKANASDQPMRFLLISGKPLDEPIARYGPFVMNTQPEIEQALEDLKNGTFVKS